MTQGAEKKMKRKKAKKDIKKSSFKSSEFIFLILYMDDILLASSDLDILYETKEFLSKKLK